MKTKTFFSRMWKIAKPIIVFVATLGISSVASKTGAAKDVVNNVGNEVLNEVEELVDDILKED